LGGPSVQRKTGESGEKKSPNLALEGKHLRGGKVNQLLLLKGSEKEVVAVTLRTPRDVCRGRGTLGGRRGLEECGARGPQEAM